MRHVRAIYNVSPGNDDSVRIAGTILDVTAAKQAEVAVVFLGLPADEESEGYDRDHMNLPAAQLALLDDLALVSLSALPASPALEDDALLQAVFAGEPDIHPGYYDLPNCFLLPHVGSATVETRDAMGFRALDNLDAFFTGRPVPGLRIRARPGALPPRSRRARRCPVRSRRARS